MRGGKKKRRRSSRHSRRKSRRVRGGYASAWQVQGGRRSKKKTKSKRKLNPFFKKMLAAKRANKLSFMYNGRKYKRVANPTKNKNLKKAQPYVYKRA
jgi:hypothetical protein